MINKGLLLVAVFAYSACLVASDDSSSRVTVDEKTGAKTYAETYQFEKKDGLVRIIDGNKKRESKTFFRYPQKGCDNMRVRIKRHNANTVVVASTLKKECREVWEKYVYEPIHQYPWRREFDQTKGVEGGNRVEIDVRVAADYEVTIPATAQLDVKISEGDIVYTADKSTYPTSLSTESSSVNYWGDNGSSTTQSIVTRCPAAQFFGGPVLEGPRVEEWDYFWNHTGRGPKTTLKTKKGHIELPSTSKSANPWYKGLRD